MEYAEYGLIGSKIHLSKILYNFGNISKTIYATTCVKLNAYVQNKTVISGDITEIETWANIFICNSKTQSEFSRKKTYDNRH